MSKLAWELNPITDELTAKGERDSYVIVENIEDDEIELYVIDRKKRELYDYFPDVEAAKIQAQLLENVSESN